MQQKIAIVCGAGIVSGKEIMAIELGEGLRNAGVEVQFLTSRWGSGDFSRRTAALGFRTHRLWLGFVSATFRFDAIWMTVDQLRHWPALLLGYRHFLRTEQPNKIIHTNWHHVLLVWPFLRPERDFYWSHEVFADKPQYRRLFSALDKRVGRLVAVSKAAAQSLLQLGVPSNKVVVIYNGISDPATDQVGKPENSTPVIGIVGQVGAWKGHEDLLNAMQLLIKNCPATKLHIFGKGAPDYEALLHRKAVKLKIDDNIVWRGYVTDRDTIFRELAILVVPSRFEEPFGLTAVEAAFFSIPVIASRCGGLVEIVEDGITGLLFECGNFDEMTQRLLNLLGNAEARQRMGKMARDRAIKRFGRVRFVQEFCEILQCKIPGKKDAGSVEYN